jgi:hypothetical protein
MKPDEVPVEFKQHAQKWIEAHMEMWWDPWGNDIHHHLGLELMRQMEWARRTARDPMATIEQHLPGGSFIEKTPPLTLAPEDFRP